MLRIIGWLVAAIVGVIAVAAILLWVAILLGVFARPTTTTAVATPTPTPAVKAGEPTRDPLVVALATQVTKLAEAQAKPVATAAPPAATPVPATTIVITPAPSKPAPSGTCPDRAMRTEPQGVLQSDGSFVAQFGNTGCNTVFEGRIWEAGKSIQNRHDIVLIEGAKDGFRYWEGNGWLLPSGWDTKDIACQLWAGKQKNWLSQGITPLPVQFWSFKDPQPICK